MGDGPHHHSSSEVFWLQGTNRKGPQHGYTQMGSGDRAGAGGVRGDASERQGTRPRGAGREHQDKDTSAAGGWGAPSILPVPFSGTPRRLGTSSDTRRQSPQSSVPREFRHPSQPSPHHLRAARQARPCSLARTPAASPLATQRHELLTGRCAGASVLSAAVPWLPLQASGTQIRGLRD